MLRDRRLEAAIQLRAEAGEKTIGSSAGVGETNLQVGAPLKSLLVREIHRAGVLRQAGAGKNALKDAGCLLTEVILLERARENGIVAVDDRAEAERRTYQAVGAAAGATRAQAGASSSRSGVRPDTAHAAARGIQDDARVHTEDVCARLGAQHVGVGDVEIVALR